MEKLQSEFSLLDYDYIRWAMRVSMETPIWNSWCREEQEQYKSLLTRLDKAYQSALEVNSKDKGLQELDVLIQDALERLPETKAKEPDKQHHLH